MKPLSLPNLKDRIFVSPTDTVIGFGCAFSYEAGKERIRKLKKRPQQSFITLVRNTEEAEKLASVESWQKKILDKYWPGPITFILKAKDSSETVALRHPKSELLQQIMDSLDEPIISTSCNPHGEAPFDSIESAKFFFSTAVDLYLPGPVVSDGASTIIDLSVFPPTHIRKGPVPFELSTPVDQKIDQSIGLR